MLGTVSEFTAVKKLKDGVYDAGQKEWVATKEDLLDVFDESSGTWNAGNLHPSWKKSFSRDDECLLRNSLV